MSLPASMKFIYCLLLFNYSQIYCAGQELLKPLPEAKLITKFPFKIYSGGVMVISAKFETISDSLNFILDTGSSGISLDSSTCAKYNIKTFPTDTTIIGMGGSHKVNYVFNKQLHFPGISIDKLHFHVNNYEVLTSVYGEKIDGIIGYSFFSRYIVKIDFDNSTLSVYTPGEIQYEKGGAILQPVINRLPTVNLLFKDKKRLQHNFYFDTGAGLNFLLNEAFVEDSSILLHRRKPVLTQAEGMGGKIQMRLTVIKMLEVGKYRFRNVPVFLYKDEFNVTAYPKVGGLLGNDLLRRFNITVNYPQGEIHLLPNSHYRDAFDYAYTGLAIYFDEGIIFVDDVMAGSPAEKAGLKKDDVLIGVGSNFTNNIMQYKTILQSAKEKIKLIVRRNGELIELTIKPGSIF